MCCTDVQGRLFRTKHHIHVAELLDKEKFGYPGSRFDIPLSPQITDQLLTVLQRAFDIGGLSLTEHSLALLHKLVAYAYIQGESGASGRMDDPTSTVARALRMTVRRGDVAFPAIQLQVIKTLLTFATAEHFIAHGDCLMAAIRTVFNLSIGAESRDMQNTARSALLQMVNTVVRRVSQQVMTPVSRCGTSTPGGAGSSQTAIFLQDKVASQRQEEVLPSQISTALTDTASHLDREESIQPQLSPITASLPPIYTGPQSASLADEMSQVVDLGEGQGRGPVVGADDEARAARLATLAENADIQGLEKALDADQMKSVLTVEEASGTISRQDTPPDPRRALMRDVRVATWRLLTVTERDALLVLTSMSKLAARDPQSGDVYGQKGKLFALELLVSVLTNPMHDWSHTRVVFATELRQPLCMAIIKNCALAGQNEAGIAAANKIFSLMISTPILRQGLKAEIGALFPLLVLRPLESAAHSHEHALAAASPDRSPVAVYSALSCLLDSVCNDAQTLVDIFVNYDCSLQAANLFERTVKVLCTLVTSKVKMEPPPPSSFLPSPSKGSSAGNVQSLAFKALAVIVESLDTWAGPIKSTVATTSREQEEEEGQPEGAVMSPLKQQQELLGSDVLQQIHANKEFKSSLAAGLESFTQNPVKSMRKLVSSGVIQPNSPPAIATFIRENRAHIDPEALGELFGHHEENEIKIMHSYVDGEDFKRLRLDDALRLLLSGFRLPGEAQKIDRIMEKFAEKYCRDNPTMFPVADAAYLLAFAIIMLNTDAHNPMAERRIRSEDFVTMCNYQTEAGEFAQILPTEELLALYERITAQEIAVPTSMASSSALPSRPGSSQGPANSSKGVKLAAAVGLTQLVQPFWSGASWDKQHGVRVERKRLEDFANQVLEFGRSRGGQWRVASHAEHARPMMQVADQHLIKAFAFALHEAPNLPATLNILICLEKAVKLSALLQLEELAEQLMFLMAKSTSLTAPAPQGSSLEAKQVACLSRLVSLGNSGEAGLLGAGGWIILLRTLSQLEGVKAAVTPISNLQKQTQMPVETTTMGFKGFLQKVGLSSSATSAAGPGRLSAGPLQILDAPGAGFALWAETAGAGPVESIYSGSATLNGDAVLSFFRALCAVSQEELHLMNGGHGESSGRPLVHMLQRAVECTHYNMGTRIRLVWGRIWSIVSQHLVSAACHHDMDVAMYAVDALRQLAAKLLSASKSSGTELLTNFTRQGEVLRPFSSVLRHSDSSEVKELAIACVSQAVAAHAPQLGNFGWRSAIEALAVAAGDPEPAVVAQALSAMHLVFEALFSPEGHSCLKECAAAALEALGNEALRESFVTTALNNNSTPAQAPAEELTLGAVDLFQTLANRLAVVKSDDEFLTQLASSAAPSDPRKTTTEELGGPSTERNKQTYEEAWCMVLVPMAITARCDPNPKVADAAAAAIFSILESQPVLEPSVWQAVMQHAVLPLLSVPLYTSDEGGPGASRESHNTIGGPISSPVLLRGALYKALQSSNEKGIPINERQSWEGVARVERHAATHVHTLASMTPPHVQPHVVRLLSEYIRCDSPSLAGVGISECRRLIDSFPLMRKEQRHVWTKETGRTLTTLLVDDFCGSLFGSADDREERKRRGSDGGVVRHTCHMIIQLQRLIATSLSQMHKMEESMEFQELLLRSLQNSVEFAISVNNNSSQRQRLADKLGNSSSTTTTIDDVTSSKDWYSSDSGITTAGSSVVGDEVFGGVMPALLRQEVEGGLLLLKCWAERGTEKNTAGESAMASFCVKIISEAARRLSNEQKTSLSEAMEAIRAPLVIGALEMCRGLSTEAWARIQAEAFGQIARLVCSPNILLRQSLQALMSEKTSVAFE